MEKENNISLMEEKKSKHNQKGEIDGDLSFSIHMYIIKAI
jgi:hypothetical protein